MNQILNKKERLFIDMVSKCVSEYGLDAEKEFERMAELDSELGYVLKKLFIKK